VRGESVERDRLRENKERERVMRVRRERRETLEREMR
jgi:hypothetical protein